MKNKDKKKDDFGLAVSDSGLHIMVDDILTPREAMELVQAIKEKMFEWSKLTGKHLDWKETNETSVRRLEGEPGSGNWLK